MNVNLEVIREELMDSSSDSRQHAVELSTWLQREVMQLNTTLTSFLDFALPSREGLTSFSLRGLLAELVEYHSEQIRQSGIECEIVPAGDGDTMIEADRRLLHQAFRNILVNAIQTLGGSVKKQISIVIEPMKHNWVRVIVKDTGPGIAEENMGRIFELFFSTRKGGSGFGLAITRKIIEEHKGRIYAANNLDQLGASFIVELPRWSDAV
jgi:signal transduction histidine kinase